MARSVAVGFSRQTLEACLLEPVVWPRTLAVVSAAACGEFGTLWDSVSGRPLVVPSERNSGRLAAWQRGAPG